MKIDNNNRAMQPKLIKKLNSIKDENLKKLFNDTLTIGNIGSGRVDLFFSELNPFFGESNMEIKNSIKLCDEGYITGAYGSLKTAWDILLITLHIYGDENQSEIKKKMKQWKILGNDFGNMLKNHKNWKNFKMILDEFPSFKKRQRFSDDRLNKYRHKNSIEFYDNVIRLNQETWKKNRVNDFIEDCNYLISMYLITWLIIDPSLLMASSKIFENRYPGSMSMYPTLEFLSKYIPEVKEENFIKKSIITKPLYDALSKTFVFSEAQNSLRSSSFIYSELIIKQEDRKHFDVDTLMEYDFWKSGICNEYSHFVFENKYNIVTIPENRYMALTSSDFWNNNTPGKFWSNITDVGGKYEVKTFQNKVVICIKVNEKQIYDLSTIILNKHIKPI